MSSVISEMARSSVSLRRRFSFRSWYSRWLRRKCISRSACERWTAATTTPVAKMASAL